LCWGLRHLLLVAPILVSILSLAGGCRAGGAGVWFDRLSVLRRLAPTADALRTGRHRQAAAAVSLRA
jgi:hypothetical protein